MNGDALVSDYLGRLEAASGRLAASRRAELADEVREHIATALAEVGGGDDLTVRDILDRLGPPEEIVAAEWEPGSAAQPAGTLPSMAPTVATSSWGAVEVIALLLLTVGAVLLPFIGPLLGLIFVWLSTQWTRNSKVVATAIVLTLSWVPILTLSLAGMRSP